MYQVRNIRNVAAVFFAIKNIDVVIFHGYSSSRKLYLINQFHELAGLVGFNLTIHVLQVDQFSHAVMDKYG